MLDISDCEKREAARLDALFDYNILDTAPEPFFDDMVRLASLACETPIALITLLDRNRQWFKARIGLALEQTPREFSLCHYALNAPDAVLVINDVRHDPRFLDNPLVLDSPHIGFYAGAPLVTAQGAVLGTLCAIDRVVRTISDSQKEILTLLARRIVAALDMRREIARLEILSSTDPLTGLCNRRAFESRLADEFKRARRYRTPLSLLLMDVDHFKRFNDMLGHPAGDRLLQTIAAILRHGARETDQESRFGGDEFALILPNTSRALAGQMAERLRVAVCEEYVQAPRITLSMGVAELDGAMADSFALLGAADKALYEAKRNGRNQVVDLPRA